MGDVIIAVVPAKGHEGLVAEGPIGERPALLRRGVTKAVDGEGRPTVRGIWLPDNGSRAVGKRALVLYAPGGPKLGMVRLRDALGCTSASMWWESTIGPRRSPGLWESIAAATASEPQRDVLIAAHLAVQRGLGVEVLVVPV